MKRILSILLALLLGLALLVPAAAGSGADVPEEPDAPTRSLWDEIIDTLLYSALFAAFIGAVVGMVSYGFGFLLFPVIFPVAFVVLVIGNIISPYL